MPLSKPRGICYLGSTRFATLPFLSDMGMDHVKKVLKELSEKADPGRRGGLASCVPSKYIFGNEWCARWLLRPEGRRSGPRPSVIVVEPTPTTSQEQLSGSPTVS